jgi:hypothetical protein
MNYVVHKTEIFVIHDTEFDRGRRNLTSSQDTNTEACYAFTKIKEKQFCRHKILKESVFLTQLPTKA